MGAEYLSSKQVSPQQLAEQVGNIDLIYEAIGIGQVAFEVLEVRVFTGIPAPKEPTELPLDKMMRQMVLKNQVALGTVNADLRDFQRAVDELGRFHQRWPAQLRAVITGRFGLESFREVLLSHTGGIKDVITLS